MENSSGSGFSLLEGGSSEKQSPTVQGRIFRFIFQGLVATLGNLVIGFILLILFQNVPVHYNRVLVLLAVSQYSPAFWVPGFFLGFVINKQMRNRSAQWVGPACVLLLLVCVVCDVWFFSHSSYFRAATKGHYLRYEYDQLFLPVWASVAYSIGAWLALHHARKQGAELSARDL